MVVIVERSIRNPYGGWGKEREIVVFVVFVSKIDPNFPSRLLYRQIFSFKFQCNSSVLWSVIRRAATDPWRGEGIISPTPQESYKKVSNYNTHECDFNTHKSDFYPQSAISTHTV
jgi:hypothetical protein